MDPRFDSLDPIRGPRSFVFRRRLGEVVARTTAEVVPALEWVEREVGQGRHAVGYLAYEAAPAFDSALAVRRPLPVLPLLWFGIFESADEGPPLRGLPPGEPGSYRLGPLTPSVGLEEYTRRVLEIQELIAAGDTYQVNLTFRLDGRFEGDPAALYHDLCRAQRSAYCALLRLGEYTIVSASPELFFHLRGNGIELRPMKGTRPRGRWSAEDESLARELQGSEKDRAENLMIVDLLRNDLGRVARFGSVVVPSLFEVERYPTVHQLTSTVRGELREGVGLTEVFRALFPSGSVTGAPKIRTSEIIRELEDTPRGVYTGAIGYVAPGEAIFSVAIRTLLLEHGSGRVQVGVGSGITADSVPSAEYAECLDKGAYLRRRVPDFRLLESLRLEVPGGYPLLRSHLERITASAAYFGYAFDIAGAEAALRGLEGELTPGLYKVRLLASSEGALEVGSEPIPAVPPRVRLAIASEPVDESSPFLFHKTTVREVYERASSPLPHDELVLVNRRGELTESPLANLVLEIEGELFTPPVEAGLLPGIQRELSLREGRVTTRTLHPEDLRRASRIYLINAVRGWREGYLGDPPVET